MKYWPMSEIAQSPLLAPGYASELREFYRNKPSEGAFYAAIAVSRHMRPIEAPHLVVIQSVGTTNRRAYTDYPEIGEWLALERAAVMENDGFTFIMMDALH